MAIVWLKDAESVQNYAPVIRNTDTVFLWRDEVTPVNVNVLFQGRPSATTGVTLNKVICLLFRFIRGIEKGRF
jgi:hypothetical protein